ncbi:hypothetical protein [Acidovorax sp. FJL06]|uniref:hypothetical protein n=1 Tax=Acidovorax sp. FJL06 TaxID=2153365 RepID=UPI000F58436A|nr:hypothetical protein [Acidovorax sp. FJL06]RQO83521.1 hypothetical protein DBV10_04140 [Acidovorax sp. FJL06]
MHNVNTLLQPLLSIPGAPPPISQQELQRLRKQAWADVAALEASDNRYHRALVDQVQHNAYMGVRS